MPIPSMDRWWPLGIIAALGLAAGGAAYAISYLGLQLVSGQGLSAPGLSRLTFQDIFTAVSYCALVAAAVRGSLRARYRTQQRGAALGGNLDAIPPSRIVPNPARAPDVAREPLALLWRHTRAARKQRMILALVFSPFVGGLAALAVVVVFGLAGAIDSDAAPPAAGGVGIIAMAATLLLGWWPSDNDQSFGVIATEQGLIRRRPKRPDRLIRWEEARLLEVERDGRSAGQRPTFTLFSRAGQIEWNEYPKGVQIVTPDGATHGQMALRQRALLDLIAARTGLIPRTFSHTLLPEKETPSSPRTRRIVNGLALATVTIITALLLALGAAALALPLTKHFAANVYVTVSLAISALYFVVDVAHDALEMRRKASERQAGYILPPAPPLDLSAGTAMLSYGMPWRRRATLIFFGILLAGNAVPLVLAIADFPSSAHRGLLPDLHFVVLVGLLAVAFIGPMSCLTPALSRATVVMADMAGLHEKAGRKTTDIPWEAVERLIVDRSGSIADSFEVIAYAGTVSISWPTKWEQLRALVPGVQRVSAEELAALVVRRTGVPLEVRDDV